MNPAVSTGTSVAGSSPAGCVGKSRKTRDLRCFRGSPKDGKHLFYAQIMPNVCWRFAVYCTEPSFRRIKKPSLLTGQIGVPPTGILAQKRPVSGRVATSCQLRGNGPPLKLRPVWPTFPREILAKIG